MDAGGRAPQEAKAEGKWSGLRQGHRLAIHAEQTAA